MKILLLITLAALAAADVSHLVNQEEDSGYHYPKTSYAVPQSSVLGSVDGSGGVQSVSYSSGSVGSLPSVSGPSLQFNSASPSPFVGASSISGGTIQTFENGGFSTPVPLTQEALARFQVSTPAPSVDLPGFQVSTPSSIGSVPSVNLVNYEQPSSSFQFLSKLSQPTISPIEINSAQFGSNSAFNSRINLGFTGSPFVSKSSGIGGSLGDSFGVVSAGTGDISASADVEADVSKNLYFFDAPQNDEEEEIEAKISLPPAPPKKNYNIIFIKAPVYRNQGIINVPAPPATEDKTLVYVLVKKPEKHAHVRFQQAQPAKPQKPEVFFIKYKTQKEAEAAVAEIQSKHGASGKVIANLPAGQSIDHIQIPSDIGVSPTRFGSFGGSTIESSGFEGPSIDSIGARSFLLSNPSTSGFESRTSVGDSASAHSEIGQTNYHFGQIGARISEPKVVSIGQQSAFQGFGKTIASGQSEASASSVGSESNSKSESEASDSQDEKKDGSSSSEDEEPEKDEDIQKNVENKSSGGTSDSEGQASSSVGFQTYSSAFKAYGAPKA